MDSLTLHCQHCEADLVFLEQKILPLIKKKLQPTIRTLGDLCTIQGRGCYPICPKCDSYALGLDLTEAFPIFMQSGKATTIHELFESLRPN